MDAAPAAHTKYTQVRGSRVAEVWCGTLCGVRGAQPCAPEVGEQICPVSPACCHTALAHPTLWDTSGVEDLGAILGHSLANQVPGHVVETGCRDMLSHSPSTFHEPSQRAELSPQISQLRGRSARQLLDHEPLGVIRSERAIRSDIMMSSIDTTKHFTEYIGKHE